MAALFQFSSFNWHFKWFEAKAAASGTVSKQSPVSVQSYVWSFMISKKKG